MPDLKKDLDCQHVASGAARETHCRHPERVWGGERRGEEPCRGPGRRALLRVAGTQAGAGQSFYRGIFFGFVAGTAQEILQIVLY